MGRCGTVVHSLCKKSYRLILQPATRDIQCALASSLSSSLAVNGVCGAALGMPSVSPPFLVHTDGVQQLHHMAY